MTNETHLVMTGENLDEAPVLTLGELCRACAAHAEWIIELIDEGVITPVGRDHASWRFYGVSLRRALVVRRLQRDLGVNLAGAALALELMDEIDALRGQLGQERQR